jgi:hypothetical protein
MPFEWLAWYACAVCLLLAAVASTITYHPDAQRLEFFLLIVFGGVAILAGRTAIYLRRLPTDHRIRRARPLWSSVVAIVLTVTLLCLVVG